MSETLGEGRFLRLVRRNGWEFVQRIGVDGVVAIVAVTGDRELVVVEQKRPAVGRTVLDLPAGLAGDVDGEDSLEAAARRELEEETGFVAAGWERLASPGDLARAHAFLDHNCNACHTPVRGVEAASCILCHANNESVLARQPTSFHANIGSCTECHPEHGGREASLTQMDHAALTALGLRELEHSTDPENEGRLHAAQVRHWLGEESAMDLALQCATCHQNDDRHFGLFGSDCSACHETTRWTLPDFRHPPASSLDCAQCHRAPPSHYMKHFNMISVKVAGQPRAQVDQCFLCHQTTSWNDIRNAGWYKHH